MLDDPLSAGLAEPPGEVTVLEHQTDGPGQSRRVARSDQQAGGPVLDGFRNASDPCGHDGDAGGHGLERGVGDALAERGQHRDRHLGQDVRDVVPYPGEDDAPLKPQTPRHRLQLAPVVARLLTAVLDERPTAHQREARAREALGDADGGFEEVLETLDGAEPRQHRDDRSVRR